MRKKILGMILSCTAICSLGQTVYQEDFNVTDGGWTVISDTEWEWGVPLSDNINYGDNDCNGSAWVTNLTGDYTSASEAVVQSPIIDCSALTEDPFLTFELYYITENCCDEGWIEFSLDSGATWTKLLAGADAEGWYNDSFNQWWDGTNEDWTYIRNTIPGAAGDDGLVLRFHLSSDGSVQREGFAFDNMFIGTQIENVTMNGVTNITSGLVFDAPESIQVSIINNTPGFIGATEICYVLNDAAPVCEMIPALAPGLNTFTFTTTEDFTEEGIYTIVSYVSSSSLDLNICDDTSSTVAILINAIFEFPYTESFESPSAFVTEGSWELGKPEIGSPFYNILACSPDSMVLGTNVGGDYENNALDYAYTVIFDFTALVSDPYVLFDIYRETEGCCDEAWVESTIDGGATWVKVGTSGTGLNWYNDAGNQWWDGDSDGWKYAYHELTGLAGESAVQFRIVLSTDGSSVDPGIAIDNFVIQEDQPLIVQGVTSSLEITSDFTSCGFSDEEFFTAVFENIGSDSLIGFTVCYDAGAGSICEELEDTILPGETYTHMFEIPTDLSDALLHTVNVTISSEDDFRVCAVSGSNFLFESDVARLIGEALVTDVSCNGETDGVIFVNPLDGTVGYTIEWGTGEEGFILGDLAPGYHAYMITDDNGCTYSDSAEVLEPLAIELTAISVDETTPGNGEIDLTVEGGTAPYFFDWDNDEIGDFDAEDLTNLEPGAYTGIVTDANGCTATLTVSVSSLVGIDDLVAENRFNVFPNPSKGSFQIITNNVENNYAMVIYNLLGEEIYSAPIVNELTTIQEGMLATGTYMVELKNENERSLIKLVIQ